MFHLKHTIYIHNIFIMSERDDAQRDTNVAVYDTVTGWNVSYFYYPY